MKDKRFLIMARCWNGRDFDVITKEESRIKDVLGAVAMLLREVKPCQIAIEDRKQAGRFDGSIVNKQLATGNEQTNEHRQDACGTGK